MQKPKPLFATDVQNDNATVYCWETKSTFRGDNFVHDRNERRFYIMNIQIIDHFSENKIEIRAKSWSLIVKRKGEINLTGKKKKRKS